MHSLRAATGAVRSALRHTLAELDLTPVQNTALNLVRGEPGSSPAELSRRMRVTPQTMHKLLTDLEHQGLLTLTPRQGSGRILDTNLTGQGQKLLAEADARTQQIEQRLTAVLTDRQQQQLVAMLDRCVDALTPETDNDPQDGTPHAHHHDDHPPAARRRSARHAP